jgi:hypothetical protein
MVPIAPPLPKLRWGLRRYFKDGCLPDLERHLQMIGKGKEE